MNEHIDQAEDFLDFLTDEPLVLKNEKPHYKIIIADDDEEIHNVTKMILRTFEFEGHRLDFLDAYSGAEAKAMLAEHPDTALIFLDVVMEHSKSGLEVVEHLREVLKNKMTRIVLRTGQPGEAPEEKIIREYDINDYRIKTELTVGRLHTTLYAALRSYRDLVQIERHKRGLEKIIETSANLFQHSHLNEFLTSILEEMAAFKFDNGDMVFLHTTPNPGELAQENTGKSSGVITMLQDCSPIIVAATGKYEPFIGMAIADVEALSQLSAVLEKNAWQGEQIHVIENGFVIENTGPKGPSNYIYIEGKEEQFDFELIKIFLSNYSVALENYILSNMINTTQKEIIITLGEVVEHHFDDTGSHIRRVSEMMYRYALHNNFSNTESEVMKIASTMHDVGKIAISDSVLKKRGKLTPEEFVLVQEHPTIGHKILSKSDLDIMKIAAEIALYHHEKYDGTGYPLGITGKDIPIRARMMAVIDVYDALTHKRIYKEAMSHEEAIAYLIIEKGKHFDPKLVDIFLENMDEILEGLE